MSHQPTRYLLPATDLPVEVRERLSPWIQAFIGLTPDGANERLRIHWSAMALSPLRELREVLLSFEVCAIADFEGGFLYAVRKGMAHDDFRIGDCWFLAPPIERSVIEARLVPFELERDHPLVEFLHWFGGLAECNQFGGLFHRLQRSHAGVHRSMEFMGSPHRWI